MKQLFQRLGLNDKETLCYQALIQHGPLTASEIAKLIGENRTNVYMILEQLTDNDLVIADDSQPVRKYAAADPKTLSNIITARRLELKQTQNILQKSLPELQAMYNLNRLKPGVVYLEGLHGLEIMLDDMAKSNEEVLLIPSSSITGDAWETLKNGIAKRAKRGVKTRAIFSEEARSKIDPILHKKQKFEVRFWGGTEYPGEVVVYGNKCVFTAYEPVIINTILTNDAVALTLRGIFENLWLEAK